MENGTDNPAAARRCRLRRALATAVLGALAGLAASQLNLDIFVHGCEHMLLVGAVVGLILGFWRARRLVWVVAAAEAAALLIIGYTPLMATLMATVQRRDPPQAAPAIVLLGTDCKPGGVLSAAGEDRVLEAVMLIRQGYSSRVVLTRTEFGQAAWTRAVRARIKSLGIDCAIDEVGPVRDTHDEAIAAAALARQRGWGRVILVTHAWHMRRAAAVFEKAGLPVICCPCSESSYDLVSLATPGDRVHAWHDWLHEAAGLLWYRWRGWI